MPDHHAFDGTLVTVPFATGALLDTVGEQYRQLLTTHDAEDILILTGSPTSMETFREGLADELPGAAVPQVTSLVVHATDVLNATDDRTIVSDAIRRELVTRFLEDHDWDSDYFQQAATQPSFVADMASLMETAAWQNASFETPPELVEVAEAIDEFHAWLAEHDHLERGQLLSEALTVLEDDARRDDVVDAEAVLVVEFEEFVPLDRRYLSALVAGRDLVCVAARDASIRRTWVEPGPITEHVSFTTERTQEDHHPTTRPEATAAYLAQGDQYDDPTSGAVSVLAAETAADQLERVADEIERLRDREGWRYDEIAVALKHGGGAITETIQALEQAGLPTDSTTTIGFGDDPAVRELLRVVRALAGDAEECAALAADDPLLEEERLATLAAMDGLAAPLRRWATESGLKRRIAEDAPPLDARAQFGNVRRVFRMAEFVEDTPFIPSTWPAVAEMLERAHEYAPRYTQTSATATDDGVRVDHGQALKNGSFRAVFLVNVVDRTYPGTPQLSRLFPQERVTRMPEFPGVTDVDEATVDATFARDSTASSRPIRRYHAEHARRQLAVSAAAASDRLYVCLYEHEETALDEHVQPSRFLTAAYRDLPWVTDAAETAIRSERAAEEYLLERVDQALADVRRTHSQEVAVSLDDIEADLAEIQDLLAASSTRGDQLRDALRARVDFAAGRVRRE